MTLSCTFPTYLPDEIAGHNNSKSCFVLMGTKVYDVTDFINSHPGGGDLILEYAGKDVTSILKNENSHTHSEAAYDVLEESLVGFIQPRDIFGAKTENAVSHEITLLPPTDDYLSKKEEYHKKPQFPSTGMSSAEDLSRETNIEEDFKTHRFLDLNKPLLMQVWNGGFSKDFYLEQIHRPRHFKGGASAPLFGNFLEPLSKTVWWVVPMVWLPFVIYGLYIARPGLSSTAVEFLYCLIGIFIWTLVEYFLHRFLFHLDRFLPENRVALTLHFLLHGIHHYLPMDKLRLVMPPALFLVLATPFWKLAHVLIYWNWSIATTVFCGGIFGYICYDLTHYFLHHRTLPLYWRELKKYHLQHHFMDYENGFGVTSRFWDVVFGTQLVTNPTKIK